MSVAGSEGLGNDLSTKIGGNLRVVLSRGSYCEQTIMDGIMTEEQQI